MSKRRTRKVEEPTELNTEEQPLNEPIVGETITGPCEYTLKKKIVFKGDEKSPGTKVKLNARQAERLRESGHI